MTLHNAIKEILEINGGRPLLIQEIADLINGNESYHRKNSNPVLAYQIKLRVMNYPKLFRLDDKIVYLIEEQKADSQQKHDLRKIIFELFDVIRSKFEVREIDVKLLILSILYYSRKERSNNFINFDPIEFNDFFGGKVIEELMKLEDSYNFPLNESKHQLGELFERMDSDDSVKIEALIINMFVVSRKFSKIGFEEFISEFIYNHDKSEGRFKSIGVAIPVIYEFFVKLVRGDAKSIFNPCIGYGSIEVAYAKEYQVKQLKVFGIEISRRIIETAFLNLICHELTSLKLREENAFTAIKKYQPCDVSFANIPFGIKSANKNALQFGDWYWIRIMRANTKVKGQVAAIFPIGPLFHTKYSFYRKSLVEGGNIRAVIALPLKAFDHTSIPASIVIIDNSNKNEEIYFADLSSKDKEFTEYEFRSISKLLLKGYLERKEIEGLSRLVKKEEVALNSYNLLPSLYCHEKYSFLDKTFSDPKNQFKYLKDLIETYKVGKATGSENELDISSAESFVASIVRVNDLTQQEGKAFLSDGLLRNYGSYKTDLKKYLIPSDAVLLSLLGNSLKPIIYKKSKRNILLGNEIVALIPNATLVDIRYLQLQLCSELTSVQFEMNKRGTVISKISVSDLLNIKIKYLPLEDQVQQVDSLNSIVLSKTKIEESNTSLTNKIFNSIKHSLNQQLGNIRKDITSVEHYFNRKIENLDCVAWDDPIKKTPTDKDSGRTIKDVFQRMKCSLDESVSTFDKMEALNDLDKEKLNFEPTDLKTFISNEVDILKNKYDHIFFHVAGNKPMVSIDQWSFKELIRNFIENAQKHAFTENNEDNHVSFEIVLNEDRKSVSILYYNNGNPFPDKFTFENFIQIGERSGKNKGIGYGGYLINRIVKCHNGIFRERKIGESKMYPDGLERTIGIYFEIIIPLKA